MTQTQTKVDLMIECEKLIQLDTLSSSDPQCIVYLKEHGEKDWKEIGRTERVKDNSNPKFNKSFPLTFKFEEKQELKFLVLDIDNEKSSSLEDQEIIGYLITTLGEIAGSRGQVIMKPLKYDPEPKRKNGYIKVRIEEFSNSSPDEITLKLSCSSLDKKDFFGKSDPYLVFSKKNQDSSWSAVYSTEVHKVTLNPSFNEFKITSSKLCNNDIKRPIKIECFDWNLLKTHSLIGQCETTYEELQNKKQFELKNPTLKKKNSGILNIDKIKIEKQFTFMDYLAGGLEISLVVAIDFTGSNGDPSKKDSLHYRSDSGPNDYQKAIMSVGDILSFYDGDKKYPVFGFGGFINSIKKTSHCFACNFNESSPEVYGVQGILDVYNHALNNIQLSGPTNFGQIIERVASFAKEGKNHHYYILLILTDGEITDMERTVEEIVKSSSYALSIIIIGIGNEKFINMKILDGDDHKLNFNGKNALRDIVQFVPFNDYKDKNIYSLAEEVLKEVPDQLTDYMKLNKFKPNQRIHLQSNEIQIKEENVISINVIDPFISNQ